MRGNSIPLDQVYGVMCDMHGGASNLAFRKRTLKSTCSAIAHEASQGDINKLMALSGGVQPAKDALFGRKRGRDTVWFSRCKHFRQLAKRG